MPSKRSIQKACTHQKNTDKHIFNGNSKNHFKMSTCRQGGKKSITIQIPQTSAQALNESGSVHVPKKQNFTEQEPKERVNINL